MEPFSGGPPPYSQRQVKECYEGFGKYVGDDSKMNFWSDAKNEIAKIIKPKGLVISFGWNSMGMGINRGFEIVEIMLVPHGGTRNDTIVVVERKVLNGNH